MTAANFGQWAFAGMVILVGYEVVPAAYKAMYALTILLGITLFYFAAKPSRGSGGPHLQ